MSESANEAGPVSVAQPAAGETPPTPVEQATSAVTPAAAAPAPAPAAPAPAAPAPVAEPSIVVDDAALAAVAVQAPQQALNARPAEVQSNGNGHAEPWSEAPMTAHDADRFASRFKASWDVDEPAATSSPGRQASPSVPPPGVWADTSREEVALPMQRTTRSPIFWGGIALVLGVCGILIALMTGSHSDATVAANATARVTGTAVATGAADPNVGTPPAVPTPPVVGPPPTSPFGASPVAPPPPVVTPPVVPPPVLPPPVVAPPVVAPPVVAPPPPTPVVAPPPPVVAPPPPTPVVAPPPPVHVAPPPPPVHVAPPPPPPVQHVAPPPPPMAHLVVHTTPANAHLTLDGATIANPFDGRLARGGTRSLSATAPGYDTATQTVDLSRDRTITITLTHQRIAAPTHPVHPPPPPSHPPPHGHGGHTTHGHGNTGHGGFVSANPFD